ncbi:MAG: CAP domain-containing protein, partial [Planctomycetota bacterium]
AAPSSEVRSRVEAALAQAAKAAKARRYADAVLVLDEALGEEALPAGALRRRIEARREDLVLARDGLDALIADITDRPRSYRRIEIGTRFVVSLDGADREGVRGRVRGGATRYRWAALSTTRLADIASRAALRGKAALSLGGLLHEIGAVEASDAYLVAAGERGVPATVLFPLIARWRGEAPPESGYVVHGGRYVTPAERDRLVLAARIEAAAAKVHHRDAKVWQAAAEELLALGDAGHERLATELRTRRASVLEALVGDKVFSSARTKKRLYRLLEERRAHALALIRDAKAWPYPNPTHVNTDEVVRRVEAVREIWERPFDVVAGWDAGVKARLADVAALDAFLVRAEPGYQPEIEEARRRIDQQIDMPSFTPDGSSTSLRAYSLKVLAYNEKVSTTSTREEKECVRAVNEYRMLMGHAPVKIDERLVRGARGHSKEMRKDDYFAHNVPAPYATPENRTPGDRARRQGYGGGVGENIARGTWTGRAAFNAWFHSSGHHRNMIAKGWTEMGAGRSGGSWWTQLFGSATGRSLKEPDPLPPPEAPFAPEPEDENGRPAQPGRAEVPDAPIPGEPPPDPPDERDGEESGT